MRLRLALGASRCPLRLFASLTAVALTLLCGMAGAEPTVRVRGESRIEIGVSHNQRGVAISGALRDELGTPLARRTLAVEAIPESAPQEPWSAELTTDKAGRFSLEITDSSRNYRLLATYAGDDNHRGVRVERNVERARADVRLELRLLGGTRVDLDRDEALIEVIAESDAGGDGLAMRLTDESGRELATGRTQQDGKLRLSVQTSNLGAPGAGLFRIESLRDERRAEAQTEARVVRTRAVSIELTPEGRNFEAGSPVPLRGRVMTRIGPRAKVPVGLFADGQHLETLVSDEQGRFAAQLWPAGREGSVSIVARTEGDAASAYPAAEASVQLRIVKPKPLPLAWMLVPSALVVVVLAAVARARAKRLDGSISVDEVEPQLARRVLPRKPQGRRDRFRVNGRVHDLRNDQGIAFAKLSLSHEQPDGSCVLASDELGRFASPVLPAGRVRIRVESPGFVSAEIELFVPHRGEWTSFGVRLESLRERALSPFRRLALKVLPSSRAWGIWTTREVREWMGRAAPASRTGLGALTSDVERACYGESPPSEAEVSSIEERARDIERGFQGESELGSSPQSRAAR